MHGASEHGPGAEGRERAREQALASVPAFAGCEPALLERIAQLGTEVGRRPGSVLQRAGRLVRQVMVVVDGVAAERPAAGRERAVSAGHLVGGRALVDRAAVADAEVVALTDVRVIVFGPAELGTIADLLARADGPVGPASGLLGRLRHRPRPAATMPTWVAPASPSLA